MLVFIKVSLWRETALTLSEMCSGSEAGSYSRLIDFVCHSTLGLRVIKKKNVRLARRHHHRGALCRGTSLIRNRPLQGYLAHKNPPPP